MQPGAVVALTVTSTRPAEGAHSSLVGVAVRTTRPSGRWRWVPTAEGAPENVPVCRLETRSGASSGRQSGWSSSMRSCSPSGVDR